MDETAWRRSIGVMQHGLIDYMATQTPAGRAGCVDEIAKAALFSLPTNRVSSPLPSPCRSWRGTNLTWTGQASHNPD
jgi:hypothetical protein